MALMITTKSLRVIAGTAQRAVLGGCLLKGGTRPYRSTIDKIGASLRTTNLIALGQPTYEQLILLKAACKVPEARFFDQIFSLADLAPLHYANNVAILKQRLKLQDTPDELLISPVCLDSIKRQRKELELDDDPLLKLKSEQ